MTSSIMEEQVRAQEDTHECQTALLMYQQLLEKHGLSTVDVELSAGLPMETIEQIAIYNGQRIPKWMSYLYATIAQHHRCIAARNKVARKCGGYQQTLQFIGHKHDAEIAAQVFSTALAAADRLYNRYRIKKAANKTLQYTQRERGSYSRYMLGFVRGLEAAYQQQEAASTFDLIITVPDDVREHVRGYGKHITRSITPTADGNMIAGYNDGFNVGRGDRLAE